MNRISGAGEDNAKGSRLGRHKRLFQGLALVLCAVALVLIVRRWPIGRAIEAFEGQIRGMGIWGPLAFGLLYAVAVVLMVPGSTLTLAAGAIFGLVLGTIVVSLASTLGAALAFLVARYVARDAVARMVRRHPKFDAIDNALGEGGWKIVALLRLSPAFPFNLQNYLFGLTRIGFRSYVLTSWIAMLPGTVMYVYLGHAGRAGVEAASGGGRQRSPAEWTLTLVGLCATIAVTVYVTRLARRAIRDRIGTTPADEPGPAPRS